ncbi:MAG: hypothetical protein KBF73_11300 [Flavobacteriales bacterium]|nr:hypothetical protein [Flavobacteriales bacterium]
MDKQNKNKEAIIAEYLAGGISYRGLETKYGIRFQTINYWVLAFEGRKGVKKAVAKQRLSISSSEQVELPSDVKQLQKELRKAQLHNKLLNAIIDIAEDQLKIDIRKKSGTKR